MSGDRLAVQIRSVAPGTMRCLAAMNRLVHVRQNPHYIIMFYVYILKSSKDNKLYIGYSTNLKKRFSEHQKGLVISTKPRRPFELIFYEAYKSSKDAKRREIYFKTSKGKTSLKTMPEFSLTQIL